MLAREPRACGGPRDSIATWPTWHGRHGMADKGDVANRLDERLDRRLDRRLDGWDSTRVPPPTNAANSFLPEAGYAEIMSSWTSPVGFGCANHETSLG